MRFLLGLTGSIGMGKSTTAQMFREEGVPVWDADAAVHKLYAKGGRAVAAFAQHFPEVVVDRAVSRAVLKAVIASDRAMLAQIEAIVHPLVAEDRAAFIADHADQLLVLDMPLLFETKADRWMDAVVVVTAAPEVQKARVLQRETMTPGQLEMIVAKQMPDAEKRARADYIIETVSMDAARAAVQQIVRELKGEPDA